MLSGVPTTMKSLQLELVALLIHCLLSLEIAEILVHIGVVMSSVKNALYRLGIREPIKYARGSGSTV